MLNSPKRLFIIDTDVLIHDPSAIFQFKEHDIFIPMTVLEELDSAKNGTSEIARNARQVSRTLDKLVASNDRAAIESGLTLTSINSAMTTAAGSVYFQASDPGISSPANGRKNQLENNSIIHTALNLAQQHATTKITIISKNINLRIKARIAGLNAEDYYNDKAIDNVDFLYSGLREIEDAEWLNKKNCEEVGQPIGKTLYSVSAGSFGNVFPNECLYTSSGNIELIVREKRNDTLLFEQACDYRRPENAVWGITARNTEQNFALNLLLDPAIEFVSLIGTAGTGKTLLALAAGLVQSMEKKRYREIVMTRETISVGEDIGYLPGTEEEKMTPWMGALLDNLEVLTDTDEGGDWGKKATSDMLQDRIKIRSLSFMRGRTFLNRYIIIDEAQNLTVKQLRTLVTRSGPGSKVVCLGNIAQIDTPYLNGETSGLSFVVDRFREWEYSGHVTLTRGERSRLADYATSRL
ncbi:MAG TPA: phosphate starvation-inducible protein PhoH [Gammaproteobacteria bacterium]|nr:phosphate starvation-inducible protein PhoH [Gammaproteobacteria bacterium]